MITSISLQNFRSYDDSSFEFESGVNIIVGPNASGKTNIIEAVILASSGKSFKGKDAETVHHGKEWARIDMVYAGDQRTIKIKQVDDKIDKKIELDGQSKSRMPAAKHLPYVLFEPSHLMLLHGSPELRRDFIDGLLSQTDPVYSNSIKHFKRALAQRNSLLKSGAVRGDNLFVWNLRLSELGGEIVQSRIKLLEEMSLQVPKVYKKLSGLNNKITLRYKTRCHAENYASSMLKNLEDNLPLDLARGFTSFGPHRDDIDFFIDGHLAKEVASRGEVRTVVLACKVFEHKYLESKSDKPATLLLDDVFSELDGARRRAVTEYLKDKQVFITTTDADVVVQHFGGIAKVLALARPVGR